MDDAFSSAQGAVFRALWGWPCGAGHDRMPVAVRGFDLSHPPPSQVPRPRPRPATPPPAGSRMLGAAPQRNGPRMIAPLLAWGAERHQPHKKINDHQEHQDIPNLRDLRTMWKIPPSSDPTRKDKGDGRRGPTHSWAASSTRFNAVPSGVASPCSSPKLPARSLRQRGR